MQEQNRTKLLAGLLVGTLIFAAFRPDQMIFEPLRETATNLDNAFAEKEKAERREVGLLKARFNLNTWKGQSLPPNALNAQRVYRQWLNDLAENAGLSRLAIEAGGRPRKSTRDGDVYAAAQVKIDGEGTLAELARFLYRFERTDLLHRIRELNIESEDIEGDPILRLVMVAEGICMQNADERLDLFTKSTLPAELPAELNTVAVAEPELFPAKGGFRIQVGSEFMMVTAVSEDGTWTVERGIDDTEALTHPAAAVVEHVPVAKEMADVTFEQYEEFLKNSPFVKPTPPREYVPKINTITQKDLIRGDELDFRVSTSGFDPSLGSAVYTLQDAPEGMTIDQKSGQVKWAPDEAVELGEYKAEVLVTQSDNPQVQLTKDFTVALKIRNNSPKLTLPSGEISAWLGQPLRVPIQVEDESEPGELTFSVDGIDDGFVDLQTMTVNWLPTEDLEPGEFEVTVKVEDPGGKSAEASFKIVARDDAARYTRIVGAAGLDDDRVAWLFDRINNRSTKVEVGTKISVADIEGTIKAIQPKSVVLTTYEGEMEIALGKDLRIVVEEYKREAEQAKSTDAQPEPDGGEPAPGNVEDGNAADAKPAEEAAEGATGADKEPAAKPEKGPEGPDGSESSGEGGAAEAPEK